MDKLVHSYYELKKESGHIELEIKFKKYLDRFYDLLKDGEFTDEKTINYINTDPNNISNILVKGEDGGESKQSKKRISTVPDLAYVIHLSVETPISKFKAEKNTIIRFKRRKSKTVSINGKIWRLDMTITHMTTVGDFEKNADKIREIRKHIFETKFEDLTEFEKEVEIEFVDVDITPTDINAAVKYVLSYLDPEYDKIKPLIEVFRFLKSKLSKPFDNMTLKTLLPNVVGITKLLYNEIYPPIGYYVSDKVDGIRSLLIVNDGIAKICNTIVIEKKCTERQLYIIDGEFINNTFYAFDILWAKVSVVKEPFEQRIKILEEVKLAINEITFIVKPWTKLEKCEQSEFEANRLNAGVQCDGYIIVKPGDPYFDTKSYKYKGGANNTIDFLVKAAPREIMGVEPYISKPGTKLYLLFVGINKHTFDKSGIPLCYKYGAIFKQKFINYMPIQFSPYIGEKAYLWWRPQDADDLDGKIVEMLWRPEESTWQEIRIREDRENDYKSGSYFGNDYNVAMSIWMNIVDPFKKEYLWSGVDNGYFAVEHSDMYNAQTTYIRFVKSKLIDESTGSNTVIDVGAGRGQDLAYYLKNNIKHLYAMDKDSTAITELVKRRMTFSGRTNTILHVAVIDVNENLEKFEEQYKDVQADFIYCSLAIHYFDLNKFAEFCESASKVGTKLVVTCFEGEKIDQLLKTNKQWDYVENERKKYSLIKDGNKLKVMLPFSTEYYEENIVRFKDLEKHMKKYGFKMVKKISMIDYASEFKIRYPNLDVSKDLEYINLYASIVFEKLENKY